MRQLKVGPDHAFYVGNEEKDMACAKNAGARSILLAPDETADYGQTHSIKDISGVLNHVLRRERPPSQQRGKESFLCS